MNKRRSYSLSRKRMPSFHLILVLVGIGCFASGECLAGEAPKEPSFHRHVLPVLSKLGCNAGSCHGMVQGRGGFRLSLFGYLPAADHDQLLKDASGRRVNLVHPENSLFLLKATGQVPHEGGMRTGVGSYEYQILRNWVAAGAPFDSVNNSHVKEMIVSPARFTGKPKEHFTLKVEVVFRDGSREDITALCVFESNNREVAEVDARGHVSVVGVGDAAIVIRYPGQVGMALVVVMPEKIENSFPEVKEHNFIDKHILARLRLLGIQPSELCDDATFLRRVYLDVTGALPTPDEVRAFLADKDPEKRSKKIEALLGHPDHAALWATKFMDILRLSSFHAPGFPPQVHHEYRAYEWLRARLKENIPYDQLVERILTATSREGRSLEEWAEEAVKIVLEEVEGKAPTTYAARKTLDLFWQRRMESDVDHAIRVGHAFLGLRLQCAQCHRHPNDVWTQDDLLSFANFFMRIPHYNGLAAPRAKASQEVVALALQKAKGLPPKAQGLLKGQLGDGEIWVLTRKDLDGPGMKNGRSFFNSGQKATGYAIVTSPLGTQTSKTLRFLGEREPIAEPPDGVDRRQLVMDWLRRPDNPFFAKAIVNRVWEHYFGRGLIDPVDDLSPLNPPSHPELLQELCAGFIRNGYDLRWLHRTILCSRTYQQSSVTNDSNRHDRRNFASFYLRRLPAEVLLDCFDQVVGIRSVPGEKVPPGMPAGIRLLEGGAIFHRKDTDTAFALETFGRPKRDVEVVCDCERENQANMLQALYFANHPAVRKKLKDPRNRLSEILKKYPTEAERITEIFLLTLSRMPSDQELHLAQEFLKQTHDTLEGYRSLIWSLVNSNEFIFNH